MIAYLEGRIASLERELNDVKAEQSYLKNQVYDAGREIAQLERSVRELQRVKLHDVVRELVWNDPAMQDMMAAHRGRQ